jgi:hypothetical protein
MRRRQRILLGIAVFAIGFAYVWWIAGDLFSLGVDEGIYLEGGRRVAAGQAVYRDFFVLTGPLTFWTEGGLARWGGTDIPLLRLPMLLDVAFLAWAVYWLAAQFESQWFAAGLALVFLAFESRLHLLVVNHRWDSAALATAAVLAAVAADRAGSRRLWLLSGLLGAAAAWATPSVAWVAVPLLPWAARRNLASALAWLAGGAAVTAAAAAYLAGNHALGPMIEAMRWTAANYTQANALPFGVMGFDSSAAPAAASGLWPHAARLAASAFQSLTAVLPVAALAGWAWRLWKRREAAETRAILPLLAVTLALVLSAWPRWSSVQLLFVAAVPFTLCGILLRRSVDARRLRPLYAAFLLLAAIAGFQKTAAAFDYDGFATRAGLMRGTPGDVEFLEPFERRIQPGDSLFVFPYLPALYPLLDAHNPTRYLYMQPGMMTAGDERQAIAEVQAARPRWVVIADIQREIVLATWPGSDPSRIAMEAMHLYLRTHYREIEQVRGKWGSMEILELAGAAR